MAENDIELTLYVRSGSEPCARAREVVQSLLALIGDARLRVSIVDIETDPGRAQKEGISYTPLVRLQRGAGTPSWLLNFDVETLARRLRWMGLAVRESAPITGG